MRAVWFERKGATRDVLAAGEMPDAEPVPGKCAFESKYLV